MRLRRKRDFSVRIPTLKLPVLAEMRASETPIQYLVGTPRGRLGQLEQGFLTKPWTDVRDTVQVKLVEQDDELYVLARSGARRDKEQAMRRRRLKKLIKRLHELRQQKLTRDQLLIKLGAARKEAGPAAWRIIDIQLPDKDQPVTPETFGFKLNWPKLREARRREGSYLLRSNVTGGDPAQLWAFYLQLVEVEQAFKELKGDLAIRPDLPPDRRADRSPHLCRVPRLLPAGHAEAATAIAGTRTDTAVGAGQDGSDPDGRCAAADDRRTHGRTVALHRTRGGPGDPTAAFEDGSARPAAAQGDRGRRSIAVMTRRNVVPTLDAPALKHQTLGRFHGASSESRANGPRLSTGSFHVHELLSADQRRA